MTPPVRKLILKYIGRKGVIDILSVAPDQIELIMWGY